jgi:hypothetical protein
MLISGREASRILAPVVSGDAQARCVLRSGLSGSGVETRSGRLYDEQRVFALAARPLVEETDLLTACPDGLYIARLPRSASVDATQPWEALTRELGWMPAMPGLTAALLGVRVKVCARLPWVATLCGFVVAGAEIVGFREVPGAGTAFVLEPPLGDWFSLLESRRLPTTVGGRPWHLWTPPVPARSG